MELFPYKKMNRFTLNANISVNRFKERLHLAEGQKFVLNKLIHNKNVEYDKFLKQRNFGERIIQLYHGSRVTDPHKLFKTGFSEINGGGNKGPGTYFSNMSRYQLTWFGMHEPVLVCDIIARKGVVNRFRSELNCPVPSWEYVVNDHKMIFPKYLIYYKIIGQTPNLYKNHFGFINYGKFGCSKCDSKLIRCDCPLLPTVDKNDIITINENGSFYHNIRKLRNIFYPKNKLLLDCLF